MQILVAGALGMAILLALLPEAGHDQLWLLLAAQRMQGHLDPYGPQVFESNPPLAIWLSALVLKAAGTLHLAQTIMFKLIILAVACGSAVLSIRLLPPSEKKNRWFLALTFVAIAGVIPARDFGQRDHILALLILPYVLNSPKRWMNRIPQVVQRIALTLLASVGVALKPHQALIVVAVECTVLLASRPRRPRLLEPLVFAVVGIGYLLAIQAFAPRYFTEVLPLVQATYWAFAAISLPGLLRASVELQILQAICLALFALRPACRSPWVLALLAAGIGATLACLLQGTGWYYQQLPALTFFALALTLQLEKFGPLLLPRWTPFAAVALVTLALCLTASFSDFEVLPGGHFPTNLTQAQPSPDPAFFSDLAPGNAVATLTTSVDDTVMPAHRYHLTLGQRYPHLWMLPAILRNQSGPQPSHRIPPQRLRQIDAQQHRFMVEDLERWRPTMILIERCHDPAVHCQVLEDRHDDLLAFFLRDPAFARIFVRYRFSRSSGAYDAYVLR